MISFVIPAFNEEKYIKSVVSKIDNLCEKFSIKKEIIVVNNGSTDNTASIIEDVPNVRLFEIRKSTVSKARNLGHEKSKFDVIAFIDGDTIITEEWLLRIKTRISDGFFSGCVVTGCAVSIPENASWIEEAWFSNNKKSYIGGANIIVSRAAYEKVGGFDESLETGEDFDFCERVVKKNIKLDIDYKLRAIHLGFPKDIKNFARREIWHGKGDAQSIERFLSSKVSIFSSIYLLLTIYLLMSIFFHSEVSLIIFLSFFVFNLLVTIKRFGKIKKENFLKVVFLNYIYFIARSLSPFYVKLCR